MSEEKFQVAFLIYGLLNSKIGNNPDRSYDYLVEVFSSNMVSIICRSMKAQYYGKAHLALRLKEKEIEIIDYIDYLSISKYGRFVLTMYIIGPYGILEI